MRKVMKKEELVTWAEDWLKQGREGGLEVVVSDDDPFVVVSESDSRPGPSFYHWYATNYLVETDGRTSTKVLDSHYDYPTTDWVKNRHIIEGWSFIVLENSERADYNDMPNTTTYTIVLKPGDPLIDALKALVEKYQSFEESSLENVVASFIKGGESYGQY